LASCDSSCLLVVSTRLRRTLGRAAKVSITRASQSTSGRQEPGRGEGPRVLQVSRHHWLFSTGGTEYYLRDLVAVLSQRGYEIPVLTFQSPGGATRDSGSAPPRVLRLIEGEKDEEFRRLVSSYLDECRPTLAHFHSLHAEEAVVADELRKRGIPYVFTYHQPGVSCFRGDLLRWGTQACDGKVEVLKCASCRVHNRLGLPRAMSVLAAGLIGAASPLLKETLPSEAWGKVDYWTSTRIFAGMVADFLGHCERAIACAHWSIQVLRRNGVPQDRITFMPQGLPLRFDARPAARKMGWREDVTVGFVGRICKEKGPDVLVRAMRRVANPNLRLSIVGGDSDARHPLESKLQELSRGDPRIRFLGRQPPDRLLAIYADFDFLAVPSTWFESGPLVVWEALSQGLPVLASARIGHPQLLEEGRGLVVEPHTVERWAEVLEQASDRSLNLGVARDVELRSMRDVADEMAALYAETAALAVRRS
jgi:glycosyltransferase involved in cell wall biosynthesis